MENYNLSLLNISEDIRKEFTIDPDGKVRTTQRGAARLLGITDKLVRQPLAVTLTQNLAEGGLEGASFEDGITDTAFAILALYVAFESPSSNPQAVAVVKCLAAIGARTLFQSIAGWNNIPELPPVSDYDRVEKLAQASKRHDSEVPQDKVNLPGWLTIREWLVELGEDASEETSLINDAHFRFWINRQIADIYRAQYGEEPPAVARKHGKGYCYPPSFKGLVALYRQNWLEMG
jgi:hypothetical protein